MDLGPIWNIPRPEIVQLDHFYLHTTQMADALQAPEQHPGREKNCARVVDVFVRSKAA